MKSKNLKIMKFFRDVLLGIGLTGILSLSISTTFFGGNVLLRSVILPAILHGQKIPMEEKIDFDLEHKKIIYLYVFMGSTSAIFSSFIPWLLFYRRIIEDVEVTIPYIEESNLATVGKSINLKNYPDCKNCIYFIENTWVPCAINPGLKNNCTDKIIKNNLN